MKKIVIQIQDNTLYFAYKRNSLIREDLMNTNIISDSEIVFSDDYILENKKIVIPFFKELCSMNHINTLTFQNASIALFMLSLFKNITIQKVSIKNKECIPYSLCEVIVKNSIKELDCYEVANFMLDYLDKHHVLVTTHSEVFYISNFMQNNSLTDYAKMFYKKEIKLQTNLTDEDKEDFESFLKINKYLKRVLIYKYNRMDLEFLLEILLAYRVKNVSIGICENINNEEEFHYLKNLNKKYKSKKLYINLVYSDEYIKSNLMKQISLNTLKVCGVILVVLLLGTVGYVMTSNYLAMREVSSISEAVQKKMDEQKNSDNSNIEEKTEEGLIIKNKYIASLLEINKDVVGYLKVNNTNIDYPVVQYTDNDYYLKKNFYGEDDKNGWVYMDFRNSDKFLNDNTIIYGHNMYYSGVMFGTLHRALNSSWYTNKDNLIISFNTMYETMNWQIFSIYTIRKTSDYLRVSFDTLEDKQDYIEKVKERSITNFDVSVTSDDYLLTLSTCTGDNERLVIHAKRL